MDHIFNIEDDYPESSDKEMESEDKLEIDDDLVNEETLKQHFKLRYKILSEISASMAKTYILNLDASKNLLASALSNKSIQILNLDNLKKINEFEAHDKRISNIKLSASNDNILYTGSQDGTIKIWDLRTNKCSSKFKDDTSGDNCLKSITSFDISPNEKYVCAGTDVFEDDAFLLFWDIRNPQFLGGYWECHTDIVTQIRFHPKEADKVASGSTDGLINIFDISQAKEDDALRISLNTESSVNKLNWHIHQGKEALSCLTDSEDFQLWRIDDSAPYLNFDRDSVAYALQRKAASFCYSVNVHNTTKEDGCFLLSGSGYGKGETVRSLNITKKLKPLAIFEGNKQLIRDSVYDNETDTFITGGESGILSVWKQTESIDQNSFISKMGSKKKKKKLAPY